jgi:hypothetical protein
MYKTLLSRLAISFSEGSSVFTFSIRSFSLARNSLLLMAGLHTDKAFFV